MSTGQQEDSSSLSTGPSRTRDSFAHGAFALSCSFFGRRYFFFLCSLFFVFYFFGRDSIGEVLFLFKLMFWFKQGYQHRLNGYGLEDIRLIDTLTWHSHGECGR